MASCREPARRLHRKCKQCFPAFAATPKMSHVGVDVAKIGSDTELDPLLLLDGGIALSPLDIDSASHRVDDTAELGQQPVADVLDDAPSVFGDLRINYGAEVILELGVCSFLVQRRKPTVTSDIRRQDSCETSLYALVGQREA